MRGSEVPARREMVGRRPFFSIPSNPCRIFGGGVMTEQQASHRPDGATVPVDRLLRLSACPHSRTALLGLLLSLLPICGTRSTVSAPAQVTTPRAAEKLYFAGKYDACLQLAEDQVARGVWNEQWSEWWLRCLLTRGRYSEAQQAYETALKRYASHIRLRLLGHEIYQRVNRPALAEQQLDQLFRLVRGSPWRFTSVGDQVALGRFFALQGEDSRKILELIYDPLRQRYPKDASVYIAIAELALAKSDAALAMENLTAAAELEPEDPQIAYMEATAWRDSDPARTAVALQRALRLNPKHVPSLLLHVDQLVDGEHYAEAAAILEQILEINLFEPRAWAYHAVLAHLQGHFEGERQLRKAALSSWPTNPEVDHLIGRKLSQKYRFAEGARYQRLALQFRPKFLPAQFQLAQDLLRLGEEQEGWQLAEDVQDQDNYNVVAYNLMTLKDELDRFQVLRTKAWKCG